MLIESIRLSGFRCFGPEPLSVSFSDQVTAVVGPNAAGKTALLHALAKVYATRHETGIEVFRDCQIKALMEQSKTRAATKVRHAEASSGQREIFQSLHDMGPDELTTFLETERREAEGTLLQLVPTVPASIQYDKLWPQVLARHVIRLPDVNKMAARLRDAGTLLFPGWEKGKRVPQPRYKTQRK
jgi:recombinational DNA repair ATPase RecF